MTREEAINKLNWALDNNTIEDVQSAYDYIIALKMAIQALEQEPCEDRNSLEEFKKWLEDWDITPIIKRPLLRKLDSFLTVQPARIHARWKYADNYNYRCSKCKHVSPWDYAYCPYCGEKMESEDKE